MVGTGLWRREKETYKGLKNECTPGTHAAAVQLILRHVTARAGVLDCGARWGALLARLHDAGFEDLHAIDLDVSKMKVPGVPVRRIDLNGAFAGQYDRRFKLICCTDVLEHLDSPRNFFLESHRLLENDGYLCVSVPNIAFWAGRLKFMVKGEHFGFGEKNYRVQRHISPVTFDAMRLTMQECGLKLVEAVSAGSFAGPVQKIARAPFAGLFYLVGGRRTMGESAIFLAVKSVPDPELRRPLDYRSWEQQIVPVEGQAWRGGGAAVTE